MGDGPDLSLIFRHYSENRKSLISNIVAVVKILQAYKLTSFHIRTIKLPPYTTEVYTSRFNIFESGRALSNLASVLKNVQVEQCLAAFTFPANDSFSASECSFVLEFVGLRNLQGPKDKDVPHRTSSNQFETKGGTICIAMRS